MKLKNWIKNWWKLCEVFLPFDMADGLSICWMVSKVYVKISVWLFIFGQPLLSSWEDPEEQVKAHRDGNLLVTEDCKCCSFKLILFLFEKCNLNHFRTKTEIWFCDSITFQYLSWLKLKYSGGRKLASFYYINNIEIDFLWGKITYLRIARMLFIKLCVNTASQKKIHPFIT